MASLEPVECLDEGACGSSELSPGDQPGDLEAYSAPGIGVSFFPFENRRWRFSAELNHLFGALDRTIVEPAPELGWLPSDRPGQTSLRVQAQFGF